MSTSWNSIIKAVSLFWIFIISSKTEYSEPSISIFQKTFSKFVVIFNKSIIEGIFPESMKTAKIIPLHKGDSTLLVTVSYRPISLLPIFSKIFERLIYNRLMSFVKKHKILAENQFGFQKNKSTKLAVNSIISHIINSFENRES